MKTVVFILLLLHDSLGSPTIEDNKIPTDQEVLGQPEEVASLGLPSDEESFNHLSVFFSPSKPSSPVGSGTYHFVSSTFPEIDARGFHESVFDGIGDYFPSWPAPYKRGDNYPFNPSIMQRLGLRPHNKFRKRSDPWIDTSVARRKRVVKSVSSLHENNHQKSPPSKVLLKREALVDKEHLEHEPDHKNKEWETQNKVDYPGLPDNNVHALHKRSGMRSVRGMEMGSSGFHGDAFNGDFGDFTTMRKRLKGSMGFHGDTFSDGFGDFATMKRSSKENKFTSKIQDYMNTLSGGFEIDPIYRDFENNVNDDITKEYGTMKKRRPEMTSMGFHGDTFNSGFGDFYTVKKRRPEMDSSGFHGDTFSRGFGEFEPFKKRRPATGSMGFHGDTFSQGFGDFDTYKKRRPEMDSMGFHGDTFSRGFGDFEPLTKRKMPMGSSAFHGDTFSQGFGDFDTYKKRRPEMDSSGFHGDTFSRGFGEFEPFKKRRPATGSTGFHGDTFSQGFGDFDTYKKRKPESDSTGFHEDTFNNGLGDVEPFKKRRPATGSMGFHGDTFSQGFGDFDTYKKRRPEMDATGFHGDTFNRGFGDFEVFKKGSGAISDHGDIVNHVAEENKADDKHCHSDSSIQRHQDSH